MRFPILPVVASMFGLGCGEEFVPQSGPRRCSLEGKKGLRSDNMALQGVTITNDEPRGYGFNSIFCWRSGVDLDLDGSLESLSINFANGLHYDHDTRMIHEAEGLVADADRHYFAASHQALKALEQGGAWREAETQCQDSSTDERQTVTGRSKVITRTVNISPDQSFEVIVASATDWNNDGLTDQVQFETEKGVFYQVTQTPPRLIEVEEGVDLNKFFPKFFPPGEDLQTFICDFDARETGARLYLKDFDQLFTNAPE